MSKGEGEATVERINSELGWQRHAMRAALTGLRKARLEIELTTRNHGGAGSQSITKKPAESVLSLAKRLVHQN
ncbi:MAG: DUF3489 domain-containing protein [Rhizobiaceae bacterium]